MVSVLSHIHLYTGRFCFFVKLCILYNTYLSFLLKFRLFVCLSFFKDKENKLCIQYILSLDLPVAFKLLFIFFCFPVLDFFIVLSFSVLDFFIVLSFSVLDFLWTSMDYQGHFGYSARFLPMSVSRLAYSDNHHSFVMKQINHIFQNIPKVTKNLFSKRTMLQTIQLKTQESVVNWILKFLCSKIQGLPCIVSDLFCAWTDTGITLYLFQPRSKLSDMTMRMRGMV